MGGDSNQPITRADLTAAILDALRQVRNDTAQVNQTLAAELGSLALYIREARAEIAAMHPEQITGDHIRTATDELDAVVLATEDATGRIMDAAERIETLSSGLTKDQAGALVDEVTHIYEACSFQDITGQRISKVVGALKAIEARVDQLVREIGEGVHAGGVATARAAPTDAHAEAGLLNGPQLPENAIDQSEIDRLMADD